MRLPPLSPARTVDTRLNATLLMLVEGSAKLGWFGRLVNEPSTRRRRRSVRWKYLASASERLIAPGPTSVPGPELPKRPIGVTLQLNASAAPGMRPGHTNALR